MKNKLCILSILICMSVVKLNAQFRLGAEVGMNVSSLAIISNSHNVDVSGGLSVDYLFKIILFQERGFRVVGSVQLFLCIKTG